MRGKLLAVIMAVGVSSQIGGHVALGSSVTLSQTHNNVTCEWRTELGGSAVCQRANGTGYVVVVSRRLVMVETAKGKVRFWRNQPTHSVGYGALNDKRVTFTETHNRVTCAWTAIAGGGAFCNKADRHGYVAGLTQRTVLVGNEMSKIVYLVNQP